MSFDMQRLPPEQLNSEKMALYLWAIAYFFLGILFAIMGWVLIFNHKVLLAMISIVGSLVANYHSNKNFEQYKIHQRLNDE